MTPRGADGSMRMLKLLVVVSLCVQNSAYSLLRRYSQVCVCWGVCVCGHVGRRGVCSTRY